MQKLYTVGIDQSYICTAVVIYNHNTRSIIDFKLIKTKKDKLQFAWLSTIQRVQYITNEVYSFLLPYKDDIIAVGVESVSIRSRGLILQLAYLYYGILQMLNQLMSTPEDIFTLSPQSMKLIAANHGHAEKSDIEKSMQVNYKVDTSTLNGAEDATDALGLAFSVYAILDHFSNKTITFAPNQIKTIIKTMESQ